MLFIVPAAVEMYNGVEAYNTREAQQATNYPNITTPLSHETAADICKKFEIDPDDARCHPDAVVYGPDFFADINLYFKEVPKEEATFDLVQSKLGAYLDACERPNDKGYYRCRYDLRGDGIYPIFVLFNDKDVYYQVIADTSGGS